MERVCQPALLPPPLPHLHPLSCLPGQAGYCWGLAGPDVGGGEELGSTSENNSSVYLPGCPSSWAWDWAGGPLRWSIPASQLCTVHRPRFMWVTPSLWTCRLARRPVGPAQGLREVLPCSGRPWDPGQQQMGSDARASSL